MFDPPLKGADGLVRVGAATYRPPLAPQFGTTIAQWIENYYSTTSSSHNVEWANWYSQLGQLHEQQEAAAAAAGGDNVDNSWDELALNAYRQSLLAITASASSSDDHFNVEEELFVAGLHFGMGEVLSRQQQQQLSCILKLM
jgi:hypothetical protein